MRFAVISFITLISISGLCQEKTQRPNIKVGAGASPPAVVINLKNPKNIVISQGNDIISYSIDAGTTWNPITIASPHGFSGAYTLLSSAAGDLFFVHGGDMEPGRKSAKIVCQVSKDGGRTWSAGSTVGSPTKDKTFVSAVMHPKKSILGISWIESDAAGSDDPACKSNVLYSQSSDGRKWDDPEVINQTAGDCSNKDNTLRETAVGMDEEHKIFVSWLAQSDVVMDRSYDGGKTWLNNDLAGFKQPGGKTLMIPGIGAVDRDPVLMVDNSHCIYKNSLYMAWADQRNGENDGDIWFAISSRRGDKWDPVAKINTDQKGKQQFMPALTVDQSSGVIYIAFYDRRNYDDNQTDVYLAYSSDGGNKFTERKISDTPFTPTVDSPFTSGIKLSVSKGTIIAAWGRMDDGKISVMSTLLNQTDLIQKIDLPRTLVKQKAPVSQNRRPLQQGTYQSPVRRRGQY